MADGAKDKNWIANDARCVTIRAGSTTYLLFWDEYRSTFDGSVRRTFKLAAVKPIASRDGDKIEAWQRDFKARATGLDFEGIGDAEAFARQFMAKAKGFTEKQTAPKQEAIA